MTLLYNTRTLALRDSYASMKVVKIICYPVKSCRGVELDECLVTPSGVGIAALGLSVDRVFCVIDTEGFVQDIRIRPEMAMIGVNARTLSPKLVRANIPRLSNYPCLG